MVYANHVSQIDNVVNRLVWLAHKFRCLRVVFCTLAEICEAEHTASRLWLTSEDYPVDKQAFTPSDNVQYSVHEFLYENLCIRDRSCLNGHAGFSE